nr:MFS transporter [Pseudonocardia sp. HH130629-09]
MGNDVVVPAGPAGRRHRLLILAVLCTSILIVSMDVTIINVALPALVADLHASITELQWTVDAYTVVLACFLMLAGATADRVGRRRVFRTGLVVFGIGSLLCSLAPTVGWLIGARVVQALGGAMLTRSPCRSSPTSSPTPGSGPARSGCGARWSASRWASARCSAGCSWTPSAGGRSSG